MAANALTTAFAQFPQGPCSFFPGASRAAVQPSDQMITTRRPAGCQSHQPDQEDKQPQQFFCTISRIHLFYSRIILPRIETALFLYGTGNSRQNQYCPLFVESLGAELVLEVRN
jgi:hypothetical protein